MADLNKVFLMGRLTADPELRAIASGDSVTTLRLATSRKWTTKGGEEREDKLFVDVVAWGRQAEAACQYLRKGSPLHVEGHLKFESWEDRQTGEKRSKISVQAESLQFLDFRRDDQGGGSRRDERDDRDERGPRGQYGNERRASSSRGSAPPRGPSGPGRRAPDPAAQDDDEEDIPF